MAKSRGGMAYTRNEYIHGSPQLVIAKFNIGEGSAEFEHIISLVAQEEGEVSANALEAARVTTNRVLSGQLGSKDFLMRLRVYPHEIVREHKFMGFAGADRLSEGMSRSFGKPVRRAARVRLGQPIISVDLNADKIALAKLALKRASYKLPIRCSIVAEGTQPN